MAKKHEGCVQAARGPIVATDDDTSAVTKATKSEGRTTMGARVGQPAPDFEATAFLGEGFENVKLSDYRGQWVALCFYPGDFTFV